MTRYQWLSNEEIEKMRQSAIKRFVETFPEEDRWMFMPPYDFSCPCCEEDE